MADYIPPNVPLYLTPDSIPVGRFCRVIAIPDSPEWVGLVDGVLSELFNPFAWRKFGSLTPEEASAVWYSMLSESWAGESIECQMYPTPFWDDESDVEDEEPAEIQPWYGSVSNPEAPAGELDFIENAALWIITGIVAIATFEVGGIAPALAFRTTVEKFIILQKRGDAAATIRYVVDGQDMKFVNTAPYAPGDIIETEIITPQTGGEHQLLIVQTS